jgi:predicted AAA+ superfamily ATPase
MLVTTIILNLFNFVLFLSDKTIDVKKNSLCKIKSVFRIKEIERKSNYKDIIKIIIKKSLFNLCFITSKEILKVVMKFIINNNANPINSNFLLNRQIDVRIKTIKKIK